MDDENCHASFLPINEKSKVQLARRGNTVYKFKIIQTEFLKQLLQYTDEKDVQIRVENIFDFILSTYTPDFPKESVIATDKFAVHINTKPWCLSNLLVFHNSNGKYLTGKSQFLLTIEKSSGHKSAVALNSQFLNGKLSNASNVCPTSEKGSSLRIMNDNLPCNGEFKDSTEFAQYNQPVQLHRTAYKFKGMEDASSSPNKISASVGDHISLSKNSTLKTHDEIPDPKFRNHNIGKKGMKLPRRARKEAEKTITLMVVLILISSFVTLLFFCLFQFEWPIEFYKKANMNSFCEDP